MQGNFGPVTIFDLQKAFYDVDQWILLHKVRAVGFR